jgi:hypothetical protein
MASYKAPAFQDRLASATAAKQKALAQLRAKPPIDEAVLAERRQKAEARSAKLEARQAEKRAAKEEAAKLAAERAEATQATAAEAANTRPAMTEAERKAARDARYAARKARK